VVDIILLYVDPQVVFRFSVMTNDYKLRHDAMILWDDGMVQCENTDHRWWLMTDYNVSLHVVMSPLLDFPEGKRTVLNCMGWNTYAHETQKWINFQAIASLPTFKRQVASQGPEMRSFERALDQRKRSFFQLYQMVMAFARDSRDTKTNNTIIRKRRYLKRFGGDPIVQHRIQSGKILYPREDLTDLEMIEKEGSISNGSSMAGDGGR